MKKVSIILPVYNSENYIEATIDSILEQTYKNFELIIVNDGSKDNSELICKKKADEDERIKYFYKNNTGVSDTRNVALTYATGDYVTFIDSDDLYEKQYLEVLVDNIEMNKVDWSICTYTYFNKKEKANFINQNIITTSKELIIEKLQPSLLFNQIWNKIYKKNILDVNNITFDKSLSIAEDLKFNIEYLKCCKKISYIDSCLYRYRISTGGLGFKFRTDSNKVKVDLVRELEKLYSKNSNKDYIYKSYIKQYISWFARTFDKKNNVSLNKKIKMIKDLGKSNLYKKDLTKILNSKNKKINIISRIMLIDSIVLKFFIGKLAILYDRYQKSKIFNVLK